MHALLTMLLASSAFAATPSLTDIANKANVGNGGTEIGTYDPKTFDHDAALANDLAKIKADFKKSGLNCGPYGTTNDRRETIKALKDYSDDTATTDALTALYNEKKIFKMYSIHTNHNIDCSQIWVEIFMTDGQKLELYYGLGD